MKHLPASQYKGLSFFLSNFFQVLLSLLPKDNHHLSTNGVFLIDLSQHLYCSHMYKPIGNMKSSKVVGRYEKLIV